MEKTGSLNNILFLSSSAEWQAKKNLEATQEAQKYKEYTKKTLSILKQVYKSNDIDEIILSEKMLLGLEKTVHKDIDKAVTGSLEAALEDFRVMEKALHAVRSGNYEDASDSYHSKKKLNNVPSDGFHDGIKSHITRLGNRLSAVGISVPEKNVIRQRRENMKIAKNLYIIMQYKALGIEPKKQEKNKGLGR